MLVELRVVVVADDEVDGGALGAALDPRRVDEPLTLLGRLRREAVARQRRDEIGGELDRVDEPALRGAWMDAVAADRHLGALRREGLRLELAEPRAVERVGDVGAEALELEERRPAGHLLVDRERDADGRARRLGVLREVRDGGDDLRHARLVVGAEERRPVRGDEVVADAGGELLALVRVEHLGGVAGQDDPAAVVGTDHLRRHARRPTHRGSCRRGRSGPPSAPRRCPAAWRRRSRARSARRPRAPPRAARRRAAGRGRAASACSDTSRRCAPTACRSAHSGGSARARPRRARRRAAT